MKKFFLVLFFSLSVFESVQAEDIKEFEIENMSVGDSLLNFMTKKEIKDYDQGHYDKNSKYFETQLPRRAGNYDYILFHIKRNDEKFIIDLIRGANLIENYDKCKKQKAEVFNELKTLFANVKLREGKQKHYFYKDSTQYISQFEFKNGDLVKLECVIYTEKDRKIHGPLENTFEVSIGTSEFFKWLEYLASQ